MCVHPPSALHTGLATIILADRAGNSPTQAYRTRPQGSPARARSDPAVLSVRRKSSRHFVDTACITSSEAAASLSAPPAPPLPPVPSTPRQTSHLAPNTDHPAPGSRDRATSAYPVTSVAPSTSASASPAPLIVKRTKRVAPPALGLQGAIDLETPTSTYTSRFNGAPDLTGGSTFPSPTSERPRYTLEVAFPSVPSPLNSDSEGSASHSAHEADPNTYTDDFEAPPSMSMLRTHTASSTHSRSSQLMPQGYGYGGEYNAAWSEAGASTKAGLGAGTPTTPGSAGLSPYRQPSGLIAGMEERDEYDELSRKMGGASRTSSFSSAHPRSASGIGAGQRAKELNEEDRTAYTYALRVA